MIEAGAASAVINNELGTLIQGATVGGRAEFIRDDLEANALFLRREDQAALLVSCDLGGLEPEVTASARKRMAEAAGVPEDAVIVAATHTGGPSVIPTNYLKPVDTDYLGRLQGWLADVAREAVASARPARVAWGVGEARVGYSRRLCWADGSHSMHGDASRPDFTGLEGPDDPQHLALLAEGLDGELIAVFHHNTAHPCTFYGASFYSADFPGEARKRLREALGEVPVVFFNGAQGDIGSRAQIAPNRRRETRDQELARCGCLLAGETLRLLHEASFHDDAPFAHRQRDLTLDVQLPTPERLEAATALLAQVDAGEKQYGMDVAMAHGARLLQDRFGEAPTDTLRLHALRLGDVALFTQPCELFCRFGLEIKRRAPAPIAAVAGLADGYHGYCPTTEAILGGGYSGAPLYWRRLSPQAGYRIVDVGVDMLCEVWG